MKDKKGGRKGFLFFLLILLASAALAYFAIQLYEEHLNHEFIYDNIFIDGKHMGGLTRKQASEKLESEWQAKKEQVQIRLYAGEQEWIFDHEDINLKSNHEELVMKAYAIGRGRGIIDRIKEIYELNDNPVHFSTEITYNTDIIRNKLEQAAEELEQEPVDASISFNPDASDPEKMFVISKEKPGRKLHTGPVMEEIENNLSQGNFNFSLELKFEEIKPGVYARDFEGKTEKLVTFGTDLSKSAPDRTHNVIKAAMEFNGLVLQPGEILSFNGLVGERTAEKGYRAAPMIVADKSLRDAIGGGVSQTSTTLYNAAIRAGLEVVEFQRHSFPVAYIEKGLDTTVNLPAPPIDLKIKNNKNSPVYFRTFYADQKIYFEIYGEPLPNGRTIRIRTEEYASVPPPAPEVRIDREGRYVTYTDQKYVHVAPRNGYKVKVYREYLEGDKMVETELLDDHYYRPIAGIIYVGVKKRP